MRIDLHAHSVASDGTESPAELVASALAAGLDVVALTDHDTTAGWDEARAAVAALTAPLEVVPGAEISCRRGDVGMHLLAYLFDPADPALTGELTRIRSDRVPRARAMVDSLSNAGLALTWEDVQERVAPGATVGRPHLADAMIEAGIVDSREEAFRDYLRRGGPHYVPHRASDPVEAVRLVRAAGGVSVLAHPGAARRGAVAADDVIAAMAQAGLSGIEVDHPDHDPPTRERLRALAGDLNLLVTGSSDYHGAGKACRLGENTTDPEAYAALVGQGSGASVIRRGGDY